MAKTKVNKVQFVPRFSYDTETFEHGAYLVIDPCYIFGYDDYFWMNTYNKAIFPTHDAKTWHETATMFVDGLPVFDFGTRYGDGQYPIYKGRKLLGHAGVDSGRLCICPAEIFTKYTSGDDYLGVWAILGRKSKPVYLDGDCKLGAIRIITSQ